MKSRDHRGIGLGVDFPLQLGLGSCEFRIGDSISDAVSLKSGRFVRLAVESRVDRADCIAQLGLRRTVRDAVACERGGLVGLVRDSARHVCFGRISGEVDSRVTDELPLAIDVHVLIVHVLARSRRLLEDHVDRSITDVISRELGYNSAFQKTCRGNLALNKRIKVQNVRCERLRIQNIASLIFKSDIEISHYMVLLLDYLIHNTCNRGDGVKLLLDSFSYIGESGQLHHAPSEGLRLLALLEQHKSGVVVEHPVAVCSCNLRSAILLVQLGSVAESRIA